MDHAAVVGMSNRYEGQPNAAAHMEVQARMPRRNGATGKLETHIFKANHPDEAAVWMADLQVQYASSSDEASSLLSKYSTEQPTS